MDAMLRPKCHGGCDSVCSDGSKWENVLIEVAVSVLDKLLEQLDHVRFATVCKQWSSIAKDYNQTTHRWRSKQGLPMLMIPPSSAEPSQGVVLYGVSGRTMYNNIRLPVPFANENFCGLGHGWFASIDESLINITLRKFPADRNCSLNVIRLPPLNEALNSLPKVILSTDPSLHPGNYMVLAIYSHGEKAAYFATRNNGWNKLWRRCGCPKYVHATFYRDQYGYLVNTYQRTLMRFNEDSHGFVETVDSEPEIGPKSCSYLVESTEGKLLLVEKVSARQEVSAPSFKVSQVEPIKHSASMGGVGEKVVEMDSIGDEALFVCESNSMSVVASNYPGCQPNSIYYVYNSDSTWEIGIFNLESKTTTRLHSLINHSESDCMPFWITPSFEGLCL